MRCAICNSELSSITFNRDHGDIDPCGTCLAVIAEVFPDSIPEEHQKREEVEPTAEELLAAAEDAAYGGRI